MKKTSWLMLFLAFAGVIFVACEKESDTQTCDNELIMEIALSDARIMIEPEDLPGIILDFVNERYFDTYIDLAFRVPAYGYELNLGSGENLFFDTQGRELVFRGPQDRNGPFGENGPHGNCRRVYDLPGDPVRPTALPSLIQRYIQANYTDSNIRLAKFNGRFYVVALDVPIVLRFDRAGNFVEEVLPIIECDQPCRPIRGADLPEQARRLIANRLPDAQFHSACIRSGTIVVMMIQDRSRIILVFDREGNLLRVRR